MQNEDILKYALENGILDFNTIQASVEKMKGENYLKEHKYRIYQGSDGKWRTYLPDKEKGRKLVKKSTEEQVKETVIAFYRGSEPNFKYYFDLWTKRQELCGRSPNTISRYLSDYKRCIEGSTIEKIIMSELTDIDVAEYINWLTENKTITYKLLKSIFGYINGVCQKAIKDKILDDNPCDYIDLPMYMEKCQEEKQIKNEDRVLSDSEMQVIINKLQAKHDKRPYYIPAYACELALYTGMRVGELSGLMYEDCDFENNVIVIRHSEKTNKMTKERKIALTKNKKQRVFPMTDEIKSIILAVKQVEEQKGWLTEFVFSDENGRVKASTISSAMRNYTLYDERFTCGKSIHTARRTLNSKLRTAGVSVTVASALLGHTERVNEYNYTYDMSDINYKKELISQVSFNKNA